MSLRHCIQHVFALLALVMVMAPSTCFVTAIVSFGNETFESMPALFGMDWDYPKNYSAHLQFLPNNTLLCDTEGLDSNITVPKSGNDTFPVVLLVERGQCSFEEKAINAMQRYPTLSYMIVYDSMFTNNYVAMRETLSGDGIHLGMLFVTRKAGQTLYAFLNNQTQEVLDEGGPIILLNGKDPPKYKVGQNESETNKP